MKTTIIYDKENRANLVLSEVQAMLMKATSGMDVSYLDNGDVVCVGTYNDLIDALRQHRTFLTPIGFIHPDNDDIKLCDDVIFSKIDCNDTFPLIDNEIIDIYFFNDGGMWRCDYPTMPNYDKQAYVRVAPLSLFNDDIQNNFKHELNIKQELQKAYDIIDSIDDVMNDKLNSSVHASDEYKEAGMIANELFKIKQSLKCINNSQL